MAFEIVTIFTISNLFHSQLSLGKNYLNVMVINFQIPFYLAMPNIAILKVKSALCLGEFMIKWCTLLLLEMSFKRVCFFSIKMHATNLIWMFELNARIDFRGVRLLIV